MRLPKPIDEPATIRKLYLESKLKAQFGQIDNVEIVDNLYQNVSQNELKTLLEYNFFKQQKYIADKYDCDNYAFSLKGLFSNIARQVPFGIVHVKIKNSTGKHSLNIFYDHSKRKFYYVEPQTNKIFLNPNYIPYMVII